MISRTVIQVAQVDDAKAWALLQRHSQGAVLPDRTYVVTNAAVEALRAAGISLTLLSANHGGDAKEIAPKPDYHH